MKKIKYLVFILFVFLIFKSEVLADGFECVYNIKIKNAWQNIHGEGYKIQGVEKDNLGRIIFKYNKQDSSKVDTIMSQTYDGPTDFFLYISDDEIVPNFFRNNQDEYVCPNLYAKYSQDWKRYFICFSSYDNRGEDCIEGHDHTVLSPDSSSKTYNETSSDIEDDPDVEEIVCNYAYHKDQRDKVGFTFTAKKEFNKISISEHQIEGGGNDAKYYFNDVIDKLGKNFKCPEYLDISTNYWTYESTVKTSNDNKDGKKFVYTTDRVISNADDNSFYVEYINLRSGPKIIIRKNSGEFKAYLLLPNNQSQISIRDLSVFSGDKSNYPLYIIIDEDGIYKFTDKKKTDAKEIYMLESEVYNLSKLPKSKKNLTCKDLFGSEFIKFLKENVFKIIYIAVPIILIIFTTIDFSKVILNDDKDGIKKASSRFGKRAIVAVLIFIFPSILMLVMDIIGTNDVKKCVELISNFEESSIKDNQSE